MLCVLIQFITLSNTKPYLTCMFESYASICRYVHCCYLYLSISKLPTSRKKDKAIQFVYIKHLHIQQTTCASTRPFKQLVTGAKTGLSKMYRLQSMYRFQTILSAFKHNYSNLRAFRIQTKVYTYIILTLEHVIFVLQDKGSVSNRY